MTLNHQTTLNHQSILCGLRELSSASEQRRLWLSDGVATSEVSSFIEACCQLYDDSALQERLEAGGTEFGIEIDDALKELGEATDAIDAERPPEHIVADPKMANVRNLAKSVLRKIMSMGSKNNRRIIDRLLEWRDEEKQTTLWLSTEDAEAISSPDEAHWHLFLGDDYWEYLDLGTKRVEFSKMFWELNILALTAMGGHRTPKQVIADPGMIRVREMADRILQKLWIK